jgi:hypothetical protein
VQSNFENHSFSITFIHEDLEDIKAYIKNIKARNKEKAAEVKTNLKISLMKQLNLVAKCLMNPDNTPFFDNIKKTYEEDTNGIGRELSIILKGVEKGLADFQFPVTLADFSKIIVAAHLGGKEIPSYLYMQYKINEHLGQYNKDDKAKIRFVYFSSRDNPESNEYIRKKFPSYSYSKLGEEITSEQLKMFLEILEARADNDEIKFSKAVVVKMLINKLIMTFLPLHIDCTGINQLENQNMDTSQYDKEAFGSSKLTEHLAQMRTESTVMELEKFSSIDKKSQKLKKLGENALRLKECCTCDDFVSEFNGFIEEASKIKQSL